MHFNSCLKQHLPGLGCCANVGDTPRVSDTAIYIQTLRDWRGSHKGNIYSNINGFCISSLQSHASRRCQQTTLKLFPQQMAGGIHCFLQQRLGRLVCLFIINSCPASINHLHRSAFWLRCHSGPQCV